MKRKMMLTLLMLLMAASVWAQEIKDFELKIYGLVRTDYFYNSRQNEESIDGIFLMFPKDKRLDPDGRDINAHGEGSLYNLHTRLGLDLKGPVIIGAQTSAKIEFDFRGTGSSLGVIRLRHAYVSLNWGTSKLLLGQTWHPLYGTVAPELLNLNTGAPYQPFSRAPQISYHYDVYGLLLRVAMVWQSQFMSVGPNAKSREYIRNSSVPEMFLGIDLKGGQRWTTGAGVHYSSITPRLQSPEGYKVNERVNGTTYDVHLKYKDERLTVAAKSVLNQNLTQCSSIGGYGVSATNSRTGEQKYAPLRVSHSWLNIMYGKKWRGGVYAGYLKNLGASKEITDIVGTGTNLDKMTTATAELTYNLPHWKVGAEYNLTNAAYGTNTPKGKVVDTHSVTNHRVVLSALYSF